ncbi:MAG: CRISPR-associated helicase Cas3' [Acidobacteriota bacterium]|nr:CRISPR-associated helicase Cas3' [Blastocatellia bacterium]MDW8241099.1 CRISPR-associated helicase Cas3' [Acidobacteriota bacterium]
MERPIEMFAHSKNSNGCWHRLDEHLNAVAKLAQKFGEKFGAGELAYWAGLWHDLGKFHPDFQAYIAHPTGKRGPDHSTAGAVWACHCFEPLAFLVAGHHGGLPSFTDLKARLQAKVNAPMIVQALERAREVLRTIKPDQSLEATSPTFLQGCAQTQKERDQLKRKLEFFLRMVFSALVDADFLDTERHFHPERSQLRGQWSGLDDLWKQFEADQDKRFGNQPPTRLNRIRQEIYQLCVQAAQQMPGIFSLTVPTGSGKTRSGLAFALQHAMHHKLDRVIVAIPYTSIIEQTADVYREIFSDDLVLEHHSAVITEQDLADPLSQKEVWSRLASQNWDAPIVVTTTVQLFESLFSNRPSACRKLHNIARSVLILDEVQTLPPELLTPILDVVQELAAHYDVSIVLCTATQPAFQDGPYLKGLQNVREIIPDPSRYFDQLRRVDYDFDHDKRWTWEQVAEEMRSTKQCLAVVNTKRDALQLLDALNDSEAFHLSTLLCGAHRRDILKEVQRRLKAGEQCRLVSTQVVEAGVDLDFPVVLRAVGPLDRIVQAAGRCNREGRLEAGRVVVFWPAEGGTPPGTYRTGMDTALSLLCDPMADLDDPNLYRTYFERLYQAVSLDKKGIQNLRQALDYPEVAQRFRLIEDDTAPVIVRPEKYRHEVDNLLHTLQGEAEVPRWVLRRLQPYIVNVRSRLIPEYFKEGFLQEITSGLWEWLGRYDNVRGLVAANRDPSELVI